jgi:hypothetical protein
MRLLHFFFLFAHFLDIETKRKSPEDNQEMEVEAGMYIYITLL